MQKGDISQMAFASRSTSILSPLRNPLFRNVWIAGILSNLGTLIQTVAAAWAMTQLTRAEDLVALVQTASMLPMMLFAIVAGTIADLYDRRRVALAALGFAFLGAVSLAVLSLLDAVTPPLLLLLCFLVSCGTTLFGPAWQASVREQVAPAELPAAIALNSISYNVGRSLGPAIGGIIVAAAGAFAAFAVNALSFLPILLILFLWKVPSARPDLPREPMGRAIGAGIRYIAYAPSIRTVLIRVVSHTLCGSAILALLPLIAQRQLDGTAVTYGFLLAGFGIGAVLGALVMPSLHGRWRREITIRTGGLILGGAIIVVGLSTSVAVSIAALVPAGLCWTAMSGTFNVSVQLPTPKWVAGRALSAFQASVAAGVAVGGWVWGSLAEATDVSTSVISAGILCVFVQLIGLWMPIPELDRSQEEDQEPSSELDGTFAIEGRNGPITIHVEYRVSPSDAHLFRIIMEEVRMIRRRNGGLGWMISRDIMDPELWLERFSFPSWHDYLQYRRRVTVAERRLVRRAIGYHQGSRRPPVRHLLDRPRATSDAGSLGLAMGSVP